MSEKRFVLIEDDLEPLILDNKETMSINEVVDKLNEQQELIEELHISDHMGWGRAEHFEKELKRKKIYIKRLEYKVQKFKEENEQLRQKLKSVTMLKDDYEELIESFEKKYGKNIEDVIDV